MKTIQTIFTILFGALLFAACSNEELPIKKGNEVEVRLLAGMDEGMQTRATFTEETPVTVYVYQRTDATTADYSVAPIKTVTGKIHPGASEKDATLSPITLDEKLTVEAGFTYDFVLMVNPSDGSSMEGGTVYGVQHGKDLLAGKVETVAVTADATLATVSFGNLPHLCSAINVKASANQTLIDFFNGSMNMSVVSAEFIGLPADATMDVSATPLSLSIGEKRLSSHTLENPNGSILQTITTTETADYENGILLPLPLPYGHDHNTLDINFTLNIDGAHAILPAEDVELPAFLPGYRYTFLIEMSKSEDVTGEIQLSLLVEDVWNTQSWNTGMGADAPAYGANLYLIGRWGGVTWSVGMGAEDSVYKLTLTPGGFTSKNWSSNMGGSNPDGTNNEIEE